jgi:hypothetical protein
VKEPAAAKVAVYQSEDYDYDGYYDDDDEV